MSGLPIESATVLNNSFRISHTLLCSAIIRPFSFSVMFLIYDLCLSDIKGCKQFQFSLVVACFTFFPNYISSHTWYSISLYIKMFKILIQMVLRVLYSLACFSYVSDFSALNAYREFEGLIWFFVSRVYAHLTHLCTIGETTNIDNLPIHIVILHEKAWTSSLNLSSLKILYMQYLITSGSCGGIFSLLTYPTIL